nr:hypothetical protein [Mycobacterium gordonae]
MVANSYGLAYLPEQVYLPESVIMATADDTVSAAERASWVTYPVIAVQRWASHHQTELRAVIGTRGHLANFDCGTAKVVLEADDIPTSGKMPGRSRLQVADPAAAASLASSTDLHLANLLPAAPTDFHAAGQHVPAMAGSDVADHLTKPVPAGEFTLRQLLAMTPPPGGTGLPPDERSLLWFEVMKPLASGDTGRQDAHLRAFHRYAVYSQRVAVAQAHTSRAAAAKRAAIADWLYWKRVTRLVDAVTAPESRGTA